MDTQSGNEKSRLASGRGGLQSEGFRPVFFATNSPQGGKEKSGEWLNSAAYMGGVFCGDKQRFCCATENKFELSH